jgi:hypothetical protein
VASGWPQSPLQRGVLRPEKGRGTGRRDHGHPGRRCHLSCPRGRAKQEVLEGTFGQELERHLHEMGVYLDINLFDPHGEVLGAPQSPARAAIRSKRLDVLVSAPTAWTKSAWTDGCRSRWLCH